MRGWRGDDDGGDRQYAVVAAKAARAASASSAAARSARGLTGRRGWSGSAAIDDGTFGSSLETRLFGGGFSTTRSSSAGARADRREDADGGRAF
eukprot:931-Pelagococcus_subviridis.AAC.1